MRRPAAYPSDVPIPFTLSPRAVAYFEALENSSEGKAAFGHIGADQYNQESERGFVDLALAEDDEVIS